MEFSTLNHAKQGFSQSLAGTTSSSLFAHADGNGERAQNSMSLVWFRDVVVVAAVVVVVLVAGLPVVEASARGLYHNATLL